nr:hypothetical protein [Novosphingobium sp. G106]
MLIDKTQQDYRQPLRCRAGFEIYYASYRHSELPGEDAPDSHGKLAGSRCLGTQNADIDLEKLRPAKDACGVQVWFIKQSGTGHEYIPLCQKKNSTFRIAAARKQLDHTIDDAIEMRRQFPLEKKLSSRGIAFHARPFQQPNEAVGGHLTKGWKPTRHVQQISLSFGLNNSDGITYFFLHLMRAFGLYRQIDRPAHHMGKSSAP